VLDTAFCYFPKIAATQKRKARPNHISSRKGLDYSSTVSTRPVCIICSQPGTTQTRRCSVGSWCPIPSAPSTKLRRWWNAIYLQESSCTCRGDSRTSSKQYISRLPNVVIALCMLYQRSTLSVSKSMLFFLPNLATILLICGWTQKAYKTSFAGFCPRALR
jgi:hypothetical protein